MNGYLKQLIMVNLGMLIKGNVILIILILIFISCDNNKETNNDLKNKDKYISNSFIDYSYIYDMMIDSLNKWKNDSLEISKSYFFGGYMMDSILVFNKDRTSFFTVMKVKSLGKNIEGDGILDFAGFKINDKWYFTFIGVSEPVVRSYWQDSVYTPLSFEELSYISYELRFKGMVTEILNGHPEKVDEYFARIFTEMPDCNNYTSDKKVFCRDSIILKAVSDKYKFKMTKSEIDDIQKSIKESKIPKDAKLVHHRSFFEELQYGPKVFESSEWKDYLKSKYGERWKEYR